MYSARLSRRRAVSGSKSDGEFLRAEEMPNEEGLRAALIGPEQVGAAHPRKCPAPTFSAFDPPVLEMAFRPALQAGAHFGRPGSSPGWGTPQIRS